MLATREQVDETIARFAQRMPYAPSANARNSEQEPEQPKGWPPPLDLVALASKPVEPPAFVIPDWLPAGYATLLPRTVAQANRASPCSLPSVLRQARHSGDSP